TIGKAERALCKALRLECSPQVSAPVAGDRPLTKQLCQGSRVQLPEGLDPIGATFVVSAARGWIGDKALDVPSPKNKQFGDQHGDTQTFQPLSKSEEHTSELQSRGHLVCRLLLEKKKKKTNT